MYRREHYNEVLDAVVNAFSLDPDRIPNVQWMAWRVAIKRLFDQGILIKEIVAAIPQASKKLDWPSNTAFFHRIEDIVYLNRKHQEKIVRVDTGPSGLSDLLKQHPNYRAPSD